MLLHTQQRELLYPTNSTPQDHDAKCRSNRCSSPDAHVSSSDDEAVKMSGVFNL